MLYSNDNTVYFIFFIQVDRSIIIFKELHTTYSYFVSYLSHIIKNWHSTLLIYVFKILFGMFSLPIWMCEANISQCSDSAKINFWCMCLWFGTFFTPFLSFYFSLRDFLHYTLIKMEGKITKCIDGTKYARLTTF